MVFVPGTKTTDDAGADHIIDLSKGLNFLNPKNDGIGLLKMIGTNGFTFANHKHLFTEVDLAVRGEDITIDASSENLTVQDAYIYQPNEIIISGAESMRVLDHVNAVTLKVQRGFGGTTPAAHTATYSYSVGSADPEGADAPEGIEDAAVELFNFDQTFTRGVSLTKDEIAQLSTEGNPLNGQLERRFIEINRQLARAVFYGRRYHDTTNKIYTMGGLKQFITSNVQNVGGNLSLAPIDNQILNIVNAGGNPNVLAMSPYQSQKLSALDSGLQRITKSEKTGGNPKITEWQSNLLDQPLRVIVDHTIAKDELWILDTDQIEIGHKSNNGVNGAFHVEDSTPNGADRTSKVIRGKYSMRVRQQKAHGYLYGLS